MTQQQLQLSMSMLGFVLETDYTMGQDYASIQMSNPDVQVPSEASLQAQIDISLLPGRITALGDIAILLDTYFKSNTSIIHSEDSWNIAGFESAHFNSSFGWIFQELPKPTIAQLESIKASLGN